MVIKQEQKQQATIMEVINMDLSIAQPITNKFIRKNEDQLFLQNQLKSTSQQLGNTQKPHYNFVYGKSSQQDDRKLRLNNFQPSHIQILNKSHSNNENQMPFSFSRNIKQGQYQEHSSKQKSPKRTSIWKQRERNSSKKKKLKIFPKKFQVQKNHEIPQPIPNSSQIQALRSQLKHLKLQLRSYQSKNESKRQSFLRSNPIDINSSTISNKLQFERTKRLSDLNNYNESLYHQLAWKLKQIANEEYDNYLNQSEINRMFLDEIYEHSSAHKSKSNKKKQGNIDQFIDIKDFEKQYEQSYYDSKFKQARKQRHSPKQIQQIIQKDMLEFNSQQNIFSPFALKQNHNMEVKQPHFKPRLQSESKFDKAQTYTFHKGRTHQNRHFSKTMKPSPNKLSLQNNQQTYFKNQTKNQKKYSQTPQIMSINRNKTLQNQNQESKQIRDLNRDLQYKIYRKRIQSDYGYGVDNGIKINIKQK